MSTARFSPQDTNYLTSRNSYDNYTQQGSNPLAVTTANFTANSGNSVPTVSTFGNGRMYLSGSLTAAGTPTANYQIGQLPSFLQPLKDALLKVVVLRAGVLVDNAIKVNSAGNSISGVTITNGGSYATLPTFSVVGSGSGASLSPQMGVLSAVVVAPGTGYVPGVDFITPSGGTHSATGLLGVVSTKVVSATVAAGGTGGTNGTQTVTGTTGTGTHFQASVTVALGAISAVLSITVAGAYSANPTTITAEPVTGAGLSGAQLSVVMGVNAVVINNQGVYTVLPANPVAQASTTGVGIGATFTVLWALVGAVVNNGGTGYNHSNTTLSVSGGGSTGGGAATVLLQNTGGILSLVTQPNTGDVVYLDNASFMVKSYS